MEDSSLLTETLKTVESIPSALTSRNPIAWLSVFGPGAVVASLTIGSGELIFSSRGGAIFGYRLLGLFLLVCLLKWALVFATARHLVLTGAHPFQRWMDLPGPRGWLPIAFFMLGIFAFPVWVAFHGGTVGTLLSQVTGHADDPLAHLVWAVPVLILVVAVSLTGSYQRLERIQFGFVLIMLAAVFVSLLILKPDWSAWLAGWFQWPSLQYPDWIQHYPQVAQRPVWVELSTYVGVVGGSGFDYLAYVSYLREKRWGRSGAFATDAIPLTRLDVEDAIELRRWLRAPLIDCTASFVIVLLFSAVFVACGAEILGPQGKIPDGSNLLNLQSDFVAATSNALKPLYFAGAFLAILGTLYGTIEVAPAIAKEFFLAWLDPNRFSEKRLHLYSVLWVGTGGLLVLIAIGWHQQLTGAERPTALITLLTPANLFTGVMACGIICGFSIWADRRHLARPFAPTILLTLLVAVAAVLFFALGIKAYWDHSGWTAFLILGATLGLAWLIAIWVQASFAKEK